MVCLDSVFPRFSLVALTTSTLAGSRAHCEQLVDALFECSALKVGDRIPASVRRNPKMFFEIFKKERAKMSRNLASSAGQASATEAASEHIGGVLVPSATVAASQLPLVKVAFKGGRVVKTKRVPLVGSFRGMVEALRDTFGIAATLTIKLSCDDGQEHSEYQ